MKKKLKFKNNIEVPISSIGGLRWTRAFKMTVLYDQKDNILAYWKNESYNDWEKSKKIFGRVYAFVLENPKYVEIPFDDLVYLASEAYEENGFLVLNIDAELIEYEKEIIHV